MDRGGWRATTHKFAELDLNEAIRTHSCIQYIKYVYCFKKATSPSRLTMREESSQYPSLPPAFIPNSQAFWGGSGTLTSTTVITLGTLRPLRTLLFLRRPVGTHSQSSWPAPPRPCSILPC